MISIITKMSLKLILYSAITIFFNGAVLRRYLRDELLLSGPYTLLVLLPTIAQPICQLLFGGFCGITLFAIASYHIYKRLPQHFVDTNGKYVFISGCDSGFGFATAKALDAKGVHVFAGCYMKGQTGEQELVKSCSDRLVTIQLDVTSDESVESAVKEVKGKLNGKELWGLVNNAGRFNLSEIEIMNINYFQDQMDVNYFGTLRLTKAFLPILRHSKGRIVTVCSVASEMAVPCFAGYNASKAALRMLMDTLRLEVMKWGIRVVTVHPSGYATTMTSKEYITNTLEDIFDKANPELLASFGPGYKETVFKRLIGPFLSMTVPDLSPIVSTIEHALFAKSPLNRYIPGFANEVIVWLLTVLPVGFCKLMVQGMTIPAMKEDKGQDVTGGINEVGTTENSSITATSHEINDADADETLTEDKM